MTQPKSSKDTSVTLSATEQSTRPAIWSTTNVSAMLILIFSSLWLAWWFLQRADSVYVNDARVASHMISISSRIPGRIIDISVLEGQTIQAGQILATIDDREIQLRIKAIAANLATLQAEFGRQQNQLILTERQVESEIDAQKYHLAATKAALAEAAALVEQAQHDLNRANSLRLDKLIADETWEQRDLGLLTTNQLYLRRQAEVDAASAQVVKAEAARAELQVIESELLIITSRQNQLAVEKQQLLTSLEDHSVASPIQGVIDETFVNPGEYVYPGQRIIMLHDPLDVWIKANVKETEIRYLQVDSPVQILVDAWPDESFHGRVARIGQSATSQFALLPSPNPSGNFTKITQRLEVKITIDDPRGLLKPGMMVELKIRAN
ncbi:MAG: HlyD family secretion protein [SAR86 cluster bacterium]|jgi:membrane fusion protein, multidrug efflux system|uniref:HlyD family secretion protein n=1 Tax=SAR86 cluster bacterium TaxID=2030880 RepID=A0A972VZ61_9GAMM|nr:HlyD family secretion protein [SAR86 cluster bacterium]|tara:strand:- start:10204 stop:11346 length:1143 start_codon:yes stop_codon:yes gene_type:complete